MPASTKPYRRFRARGGGTGGGLDELRTLNARPGVAPPPDAAPKPRREPRIEVLTARPPRRGRWSLRGIGVWGWVWRLGLLLLMGVGVWATLGFLAVRGAVSDANARIAPAAERVLDEPRGGLLSTTQNTLVIGADGRVGETRSRADTILIMRTDPGDGRIKWLSIPRDFRVEIPGRGPQKINAAYYYGGQPGIIRAVKRVTGLPIHHLVVVSFRGFPKLVDELGGVTVTNPTRLVRCPYPGGRTVSFPRGEIELNGRRALEYVRVRKCDDDFRRAQRQQAFASALRERIVSVPGLPQAPWRGAAAIRAISTDLGTLDMLKMGWLQMRLDQDPRDRLVLAGTPRYVDGQSFVVGEPDLGERQIARFVGRR